MRRTIPVAVAALLLLSSCAGDPDEVETSASPTVSASPTEEASPEPLAWETEEGLISFCDDMLVGVAALPHAETLEYKVTPVMPVEGGDPYSKCLIEAVSPADGAALGDFGSAEILLVNRPEMTQEDWGNPWTRTGNGLSFIPEDGAWDTELRGDPGSWGLNPYTSAGPITGHYYQYNFIARIGIVEIQPVIRFSTTDTSGQLAEDYREDAAVVFDAYMQYLNGALA
jgi:hypothetical protein